MYLEILAPATTLPLSLEEVKTYLRISHSDEDEFLKHILTTATGLIEDQTQRCLLEKTLRYTQEQNRLLLPLPPTQDILEVKLNKKTLREDEYNITFRQEQKIVEVPFRWSRQILSVTYKAGYGKPMDIPAPLRQAILSTTAYLYEDRTGVSLTERGVYGVTPPWILRYRTYSLR